MHVRYIATYILSNCNYTLNDEGLTVFMRTTDGSIAPVVSVQLIREQVKHDMLLGLGGWVGWWCGDSDRKASLEVGRFGCAKEIVKL